jgi:hypothetical protein
LAHLFLQRRRPFQQRTPRLVLQLHILPDSTAVIASLLGRTERCLHLAGVASQLVRYASLQRGHFFAVLLKLGLLALGLRCLLLRQGVMPVHQLL